MLFEIAKKFNFIQNVVVNLQTSLHPSIMHNLGKIEIIKKAMWHSELESLEGDYFEFGIYEGTSLYAAVKSHLKIKSKFKRNFYGFDSFDDGFKYFDEKDKHPFFKEGDFVSSYAKAKKRFSNFSNVKLIKGYFEETTTTPEAKDIYGENLCAIVFIDCDLMHPTVVALEYVRPILQKGTIIILDDYFAYKGDENLGTSGALKTFLQKYPTIKVREFADYGYGGKSFVVTGL
jgi:Macrocin-O-methyltransferase (TylF)